MATKPRPFQRKGVDRLLRYNGRAMLADEMGLGKTFQALLYRKEAKLRPTIVVCPAFLKYNWEEEARMHFGDRCIVLEGRKTRELSRLGAPIIIVNYEILGAWLKRLVKLDPQLVIIEEAHYISNPKTARAQAVRLLCAGGKKKPGKRRRRVKKVIAISGTPLTSRPSQLWNILNILWPKVWPSWFEFAHRYCQPRRKPWGWEFKGATRLKELRRKMRECGLIRRLKKNVLKELPAKSHTVVQLDIRPKKEYTEAVKDFIGWLKKRSIKKARKAAKAEQLVKMGELRRLASELKQAELFKWIDNFLETSNGKMLLFGVNKAVLKPIYQRYKKISILIDGTVSTKKRHKRVKQFQSNKATRLAVLNVQAGGVGITLTAADTVGIVQPPWNPGEVNQAIDRAHRIGQKKSVNVFWLVGKETIEQDACHILRRKSQIVDKTLDGASSSEIDLDVFDELTRTMIRKAPTYGKRTGRR